MERDTTRILEDGTSPALPAVRSGFACHIISFVQLTHVLCWHERVRLTSSSLNRDTAAGGVKGMRELCIDNVSASASRSLLATRLMRDL